MIQVIRTTKKRIAKCMVAKVNEDDNLIVEMVEVPFYGNYEDLSERKKYEYACDVVAMNTNGGDLVKVVELSEPTKVRIALDFNQFAFFGREIPVRENKESELW